MLQPNFEAIPVELRERPRWVTWRNKVPYVATADNRKASATDAGTWSTFDQAREAYQCGGWDGVGFVLDGDGVAGIDLDKCVSGESVSPAAMEIMRRAGCTYVERSPSGTGLRGFGLVDPVPKSRRGELAGVRAELYTDKRFLTVTGHAIQPGPVAPMPGFGELVASIGAASLTERTERTEELHSVLSDLSALSVNEAIRKTLPAAPGERNRRLFDYARWAKFARPGASKSDLIELARQWHQQAMPTIATKEFAVTLTDFLYAHAKARVPLGADVVTLAVQRAGDMALPPALAALELGDKAEALARVCMAMQSDAGTFFLSSRDAGRAIDINHTDAMKTMSALVDIGFLTRVEAGTAYRATRYRVNDSFITTEL